MADLFRSLTREHGITRLWRGLEPALVRISIGSGTYFTTQNYLINHLKQRRSTAASPHGHDRSPAPASTALSSSELLSVGFVARGAAVAMCCPISVVKTRIEGNAGLVYKSTWEGLQSVLRHEGVRGLYLGLVPSLIKDCPYAALYLLFYSSMKTSLVSFARLSPPPSPVVSPSGTAPPTTGHHVSTQTFGLGMAVVQFTAAFTAASVATTAFQPFEVLKTRLQLQRQQMIAAASTPSPAAVPNSTTTNTTNSRVALADTSRAIWNEHGVRGFFRGLLPRLIRRSFSNALSWMMYEQLVVLWRGTTGL